LWHCDGIGDCCRNFTIAKKRTFTLIVIVNYYLDIAFGYKPFIIEQASVAKSKSISLSEE